MPAADARHDDGPRPGPETQAALNAVVAEWDELISRVRLSDLDAMRALHDGATATVAPSPFAMLGTEDQRQRLLYVTITSIAMMAVAAEIARRNTELLRRHPECRPSFMRRALRWPLRLIGVGA